MEKDKDSIKSNGNKAIYAQVVAILFIVVFVSVMIYLVIVTIYNNCNNPINPIINNLNQPENMTSAAVSAIASNAISSASLIITVIGVFMTGVSIFAALIVYINYSKLSDIDKKMEEVDKKMAKVDTWIADVNKQISVETNMRHLFSGIRYWEKDLYSYALIEFNKVLASNDDACCLSANYYMGILYSDRFKDTNNPNDFKEAEKHLLAATKIATDIDPIIHNDLYASLGGLYGLGAEKDFNGAFCEDYLNKSEEYLLKAISTFGLAVHYKNIAITYGLKKNKEKAIEYIEKGIQVDACEKGITDKTKEKENAEAYIKNLFSEEEIQLIPDICKEIKDQLVGKYKSSSKPSDI